jgi:hypothetical protein
MFCRNCGTKLSDNAMFCNNCGVRQNLNGQAQGGQPISPQGGQTGAYYQPSGQFSAPPSPSMGGMPPKNNSTKIILVAIAGLCVVLAAVLILVLVKPFSSGGKDFGGASLASSARPGTDDEDDILTQDNEDDNSVPNADALDGDADDGEEPSDAAPSDNTPTDSAPAETADPGVTGNPLTTSPNTPVDSLQAFTVFDAPTWSTDPIYMVIDEGGVWTSVGIATNPNQVSGSEGVFNLDDIEGCMYYMEFFADLTWNFKYDEGVTGVETRWYEIMDTEYCDTFMDEDGMGYRFYYGNDGRLYMCFYSEVGGGNYPDLSDFLVFERKGDTIDWAAEAAAN